jgi:DNA polymerase elongation subunit (family B)
MYVDALHSNKDDMIRVVERVNGERVYKDYKPDWHFYVNDANGQFKTIYGNPVKRIDPANRTERNKIMAQYSGEKWESDINAVFRCLAQEYPANLDPQLHVAFYDIETAFDQVNGYSEPGDAMNPITSIAVYLQWIQQMVCFAVPPAGYTWEEAQKIAAEVGPEVILFKTEKEMLNAFLDIIDDADILSGWNSEGYDMPYTVNRIIRLLGKSETRRMCLWGTLPKLRMFERGGKEYPTYDLIGRVHVDYMQLYKKYTYEERHSYSLDAISEYELDEKKVAYSGTLDQLYNKDFKKFLEYNIQDTALLDKLDRKLQFIDLCSSIAHANCVLLPTTMGAVATIDQAVVIEAHRREMIVPNKKEFSDDVRAAGGWVAHPKAGLHKWVGASDLNSLYPSIIRALNMSPETIVAQVDLSGTNKTVAKFETDAAKNTFALWWNDRFCPLEMEPFFENNNHAKISLRFENGTEYHITGSELRELVFNGGEPWCISANGTIYKTDVEGVIPGLLTRWFRERKELQAIMRGYKQLEDNDTIKGLEVPQSLFTLADVNEQVHHASTFDQSQCFDINKARKIISTGDKTKIADYLNSHKLTVKCGKAIYRDQSELKKIIAFWDKRQLVKKILLNSAYGALLNAGSRFFDQRIGQSTTLTGRNITRHMAAKTNEYITGIYDYQGEAIIYGDTDSTYFSEYPAVKDDVEKGVISWTKEDVISIYDQIASDVSDSFPQFALETFNVPLDKSTGVIKSGREIIAESALYITKKRYAALVYDEEGTRKDINGKPGKIKVTGLDLRRSDTPKFVQAFLMDILTDTLTGKGEEYVVDKIKVFKADFVNMKPWEKGSPKAVNNLSSYRDRQEENMVKKLSGQTTTFTMPGHVRASLNWNTMVDIYKDKHTPKITDGQKVIVCKLKENSTLFNSVAYPVDITHLPDWFMELPFDDDGMLGAIVDKKVENLLHVLKWDLSKTNESDALFDTLFG